MSVNAQEEKSNYHRQQYCGSIVHDHAHYTNEGFGSLARNMIYPIIHIALSCNLQPLISNTLYDYNTSRPNYKTQLQSITKFLSLSEYSHQSENSDIPIEDDNRNDSDNSIIVKLEINTWNDANIGSCCGDAMMMAKELSNYLHKRRYANHTRQRYWFDVRLVGAIRCMDPTPIVYEWLQNLSKTWILDNEGDPTLPKQLYHPSNSINDRDHTSVTDNLDYITTTVSNTATPDGSYNGTAVIRIVAHVRVPEDFTCQSWKDDNHIDKLYLALDTILPNMEGSMIPVTIDIYTEEHFTMTNELECINRYQNRPPVHDVRVHRGTTASLLNDIQRIVQTAHVFIPSASYFSAFCGYLIPPPGIIVLSHPSRWLYFTSHHQLMLRDDRALDMLQSTGTSSGRSRIIDISKISSSLDNNEVWQNFISTIQTSVNCEAIYDTGTYD
jgi:hypothetical protein